METVALMYSGGVDSTLCAGLLLERFERLHLLTWGGGPGIICRQWSRKAAADLLERYPGRVSHDIGSCRAEFDRLLLRRLGPLYRRHRSRFVWCLGCKVSMHIATLRHCLAHDIRDAADGSSLETPYYVEQMPVALAWFERFYDKHGVRFHTPAQAFPTREEKIRWLDDRGLRRGKTRFGRNPGTQPLCLAGNLIYFRSTFFKQHPAFNPYQVARFLEENEDLFDELTERTD